MSVDLPGIRARAEFDLNLFKQQEEQIKNALRGIANEMRAVPSARIRFDTSGTQREARAAVGTASNLQREITREMERGITQRVKAERAAAAESERIAKQSARETTARVNAEIRAEKLLAQERISNLNRVARATEQFNARQRAENRARLAEEARLARETAGQERRVARAELPVAAGLGVFGGLITKQLVDATGAAADFSKAMSQVRAVMTPAEWRESGAAITQLARSLGAAGLGFTATEAAAALEAMTKAGISVKDQLAGAPAVLALAAAGNVQLADAANLAASAIQTFNKSGAELESVANTIIGVANATIADVDDLRMSFAQASAAGKLTGQTFEEIALSLGLLAQAGIRSSDAGTSLRVMMLRLTPQSSQAAEAMLRFGIILNGQNRFIDEATGNFKSLSEVAQVLQETLGDATQAQQQFALRTIFGQDAVRAATVLLKGGAKAFEELNTEVNKTTALDVARTRLDNLRGDLIKLTAAWENAQITLGKTIEPSLRPLVQSFVELLTTVKQVSPEMARTTLAIVGATGASLAVSGAVLTAVAAFKLLGITAATALAALGAIAPPVGALIVVSATLAAAWVNNWGDIQGKTQEASREVIDSIQNIAASIRVLTEAIGNAKIDLPIIDGLREIVGQIGRLGEQAGIKWGEEFSKGARKFLLSFLSLPAGGALGRAEIQATIDALDKLGESKRRAEADAARQAFESGLTPEIKSADQERIAKKMIGNLPDIVKESIVRGFVDAFELAGQAISQSDIEQKIIELGEKYGEAFTNLDPEAQFKAAHRALVQELVGPSEEAFKRLGSTLEDVFKELGIFVTQDVMDDIINVFTADAAGRLAAAGEQNAAAYAGPWVKAHRILEEAQNNFDDALQRVGSDTEAIQILLQLRDAADATNKAYKDLADRGIAAALLAKRNDALQTKDLEERTRALIEVGQEFIAHKEAEAKSLEEVTKWQKLQADIADIGPKLLEDRARSLAESVYPQLTAQQQIHVRTLQAEGKAAEAAAFALQTVGEDAVIVERLMSATGAQAERTARQLSNLAQIPFVGIDQFIERVNSLSNSALPGLTAAEQEHVRVLQLQERHLEAAQFAVVALGGDASQLGDILEGTGQDVARANAEIAELARVRDTVGNAFQITRDRAKSFFNTIVQGAPAAERAQLELVSATQGPLEALRQAWVRLGLDIAQLPDLANASARKIQEAQRKVEARQFFLETGELLPASKMETAGSQFREAAKSAEQAIAKAREGVTKQLEQARKQWSDAVSEAAKTLGQARAEFSKNIAKIDADLQKTEADINAAIASAIASYNTALAGLASQEAKLRSDFAKSQAERARSFTEQAAAAAQSLAQQLRETSRQIAQTVFDATRRQREQLQQLAQQLSDLRSRDADESRSLSVRLQDIALKEFKATTEEERQELLRERIRLQADAGAQSVQLQREINRGQSGLRQQTEATNDDMLAAVDALRQQAVTAIDNFRREQQQALQELIRAQKEAEEQFREQLKAIEKQRAELEAALRAQLEELRKRREEARKQAKEAKEAAQRALDEAERIHQEQLQKAQDQLDLAERLSIEELNAAQDKFNEQMAVAQEALNAAQRQAGSLDNINNRLQGTNSRLDTLINQRRPFQINMPNMNVEEGDVEFLEHAAEEAEELARQPIG